MGTLLDLGEIRTMANMAETADIVTDSAAIPGLLAE